jgi:hypothetical protein
MLRSDIESLYTIENGRIRSPGKFEQEMVYVVHFWQQLLDGWGHECSRHRDCVWFNVLPEDKATFPELKNRRTVHLTETNDGFVVEV